jgi:hypothetical protein
VALDTGVQGRRGEPHLEGLRPHPLAAKYNENRGFTTNGHGGGVQSLVISATYAANSLLGGSMEIFAPINEFCAL